MSKEYATASGFLNTSLCLFDLCVVVVVVSGSSGCQNTKVKKKAKNVVVVLFYFIFLTNGLTSRLTLSFSMNMMVDYFSSLKRVTLARTLKVERVHFIY